MKSLLERMLRAQRGAAYFARPIASALEKLDEVECEALFRIIENRATDAEQTGRRDMHRDMSRNPHRRP